VHSLTDLDDLVLREDGSAQRVLQRDDSRRSVVNVVFFQDEVGLDVVLEGEMVSVCGENGC